MKLKPCPFCGAEPTIITYNGKDGWRDRYAVLCKYDDGGCGAESGVYHSVAEALEAWNRRDGVDEKKLSCHFEYCKDCLSLIKRRIPDTEVVFEIRCARKHKGIILKGERLLSFGDITPEDFDKEKDPEEE